MPCSRAAWWRSPGFGAGMIPAATRAGFHARSLKSVRRTVPSPSRRVNSSRFVTGGDVRHTVRQGDVAHLGTLRWGEHETVLHASPGDRARREVRTSASPRVAVVSACGSLRGSGPRWCGPTRSRHPWRQAWAGGAWAGRRGPCPSSATPWDDPLVAARLDGLGVLEDSLREQVPLDHVVVEVIEAAPVRGRRGRAAPAGPGRAPSRQGPGRRPGERSQLRCRQGGSGRRAWST